MHLHVGPAVQVLQHPLFQVGWRPRVALVSPKARGQLLHQHLLVLWSEAVLAGVAVEPLRNEGAIQGDRADGFARELGTFDLGQALSDHVEHERTLGELAEVVDASDEVHQLVDVRVGNVRFEVLTDLLFAEGKHDQCQVIPAAWCLTTLAGEVRNLVFDGAKEMGAAGQQKLRRVLC